MDDSPNVVEKVLNYDLLLREIFKHLSASEIQECSNVCRTWYDVCKDIDAKLRTITLFAYSFFLPRFEAPTIVPSTEMQSMLTKFKTKVANGLDNFKDTFKQQLQRCYTPPELMILVEGSNTKVISKHRKWKRAKIINSIRSMLPKECNVVGIDAHYGIMNGSSDCEEDPIVLSHPFSAIFGVSCCLIPKYNGVSIEVLDRSTEISETRKNVKAMVLFSSGVSYKGEYLTYPSADQIIESMDGKLAVGGAQVNDTLVTFAFQMFNFSDDTANYYFLNGPPPYNPMYNPRKRSLISILFSGPKCDAASLSINVPYEIKSDDDIDPEREIAYIEAKVEAFRRSLDFDTSQHHESLGFLFFNHKRYRIYVDKLGKFDGGVSIFFKAFPSTKIIGLLSHAQYEYDYCSGVVNEESLGMPRKDLLPLHGIASFVLIRIDKD